MPPAIPADLPDWTDPSAYASLLKVERAGFAWEWLRRDAAFREAALEAVAGRLAGRPIEEPAALTWHLHRFEDPRLAAPEARPLWAASRHSWVVAAHAAAGATGGDSFELRRLPGLATLVEREGVQRLLLSDGYRSIRLDVAGADLAELPVRLSYHLRGIRSLEQPLVVLRRFRALVLGGRFCVPLHALPRRAPRLVTLLRACDGIAAGATQADLAAVLLNARLEHRRWRVHSPSIRSQAQRLARAARSMAREGFWRLLD